MVSTAYAPAYAPAAQSARSSAARPADSYVGRRGGSVAPTAETEVSVHGDLKVLRSLAAKQNATRRMGKNRRTHGRAQAW